MKNVKIKLISGILMSVLMPLIALANLPYKIAGKVTTVAAKDATHGAENCEECVRATHRTS